MPKAKAILVSFTAERLQALDDRSARQYRDRTGILLTDTSKGNHVCVEFPPDGERKPVRLERVPREYLRVVDA